MDTRVLALVFLVFLAPTLAGSSKGSPAQDTDGDGLSDLLERHKYRTSPVQADSDGDGVPDGDWQERREFTYTIRTILQVLPPVSPDVFSDDFQDARILDETKWYVELEVIHYPLSSVNAMLEKGIEVRHTEQLEPYLQSTPSSDWTPESRAYLVAELAKDGIDVHRMEPTALVRAVAPWLMQHARCVDRFSTFTAICEDGEVRVHPDLVEWTDRQGKQEGMEVEEAWDRELFASRMLHTQERGTCTSTAIYLGGALRSLGIPTRIVLCTPLADATDASELVLVARGIRNERVRHALSKGLERLTRGWSSHTFNEVFLLGRWWRLDGPRLGIGILDPGLFGLLTHVGTMRDFLDGGRAGGMAETWGRRGAIGPRDDAFGGGNPYSMIAVSDRFGVHATLDLDAELDKMLPKGTGSSPDAASFDRLTIDQAIWNDDPAKLAGLDLQFEDLDTAGHVYLRVKQGSPGHGVGQYRDFWKKCVKGFELHAPDQKAIPASLQRGYIAAPERGLQHFYLRIEPADFARMAPGVAYKLRARAQHIRYQWSVDPDLRLTR